MAGYPDPSGIAISKALSRDPFLLGRDRLLRIVGVAVGTSNVRRRYGGRGGG